MKNEKMENGNVKRVNENAVKLELLLLLLNEANRLHLLHKDKAQVNYKGVI